MDESLFEKFSKLTHRGQVPKLLCEEISDYADSHSIFLVKKGVLYGWHSTNIPQFSTGKEIRDIQIPLNQEKSLYSSFQKGKISVFRVPSLWHQYGLISKEDQDLICGSFPLKYGNKIFGILLCFKKEKFRKDDLEKIKEVALCASEFSVILPPPTVKKDLGTEGKEKALEEIEKIIDFPDKAQAVYPEKDQEEKELCSEARILARLLINDIKLYHEQDVILGRLKKDLNSRLRKEIEKAERFYNMRIPSEIRKKENMFEKELIENLAGGDASALGPS